MFLSFGRCFCRQSYYDSALFYYRVSIPFTDDIKMKINRLMLIMALQKYLKKKTILILQYCMLKKYWLKKSQNLILQGF